MRGPFCRLSYGLRNILSLLAAALIGGALLIVADAIARTIRAPIELPVGAITAIVGVPFFLVRMGRLR